MKKLPKTIFGFPVGDPEPGQPPEQASRRGIAMIISLFMIAIMALFMADMQVNALVQSEMAIANRDNLKAEYIAKSGANLATFLLSVDLAVDLTMAELGGPNAQVSDGPGDIWAQLNGLPIGGETLEMLGQMQETFELSKVADSRVIDQLKQFEGSFTVNISDESSRININFCGDRNRNQRKVCQTFLKALMSCPAEKSYLDERKVNPDELIANLEDWIDDNQNPSESGGRGSESDPYADRVPKVVPKNAPLDTIDELRAVAGWDVDLEEIFSPYMTVYPIPYKELQKSQFAINFNTASRELLNCLFPKAVTDCAEKSALYIDKRAEGEAATSTQGVQQMLQQTFCAEGEASKSFTYRSDTYRVTVEATSGNQKKRMEFVVARRLPDDQDTKNQYKSAYKYLYWKML